MLNKLADARLITLSQETAEVAHEALIREWDRLRDWLDEEPRNITTCSANSHRGAGMGTTGRGQWDALYRGARLAQADEWAAANPGRLSVQEQSLS